MSKGAPTDFEDYALRFPKDVQALLRKVRRAIQGAAPRATETISYQMPAFRLGGILVWFGAHAEHIGFYPGAAAIAAFKKDLSAFKSAKGSVQFSFSDPLPLKLITRIVEYRIRELRAKAKKT